MANARSKALTERQEKFVQEYYRSGNGTASIKAAGYKCRSDNAAGVQANVLLKNAKIQLRLRELREAATKEFTVTSSWILEQVASIAKDKGEQAKDRLKALELLGKHVGTWEPVENNGSGVKVELGAAEVWAE